MQTIKNLFWNDDESRVRAPWRLSGQLILLTVTMLPLTCLGTAVLGILLAREDIPPAQLSTAQTVQQLLTESPAMMAVSMLMTAASFTTSIWLAGRLLDQRPFADFGLHINKDWWIDFGFGLLQGALLMGLIFLTEFAADWLTINGTFVTRSPDAPFLTALLPPLLTFLAVGFYEELFSRGYQLRNIAEGLNWKTLDPRAAIVAATLLSSAVFGLLHVANPNTSVISTLNLSFAGIHLAMGYLLTGELAIPIGLHIAWNFFQGNVFGFPVSGVDYRSAAIIGIEQKGPDVWTGGTFGPEAGLLGLGAMVLGSLLTVLWVHWRHDRTGLHLALAEAPKGARKTKTSEAEVVEPDR